MKVAKNFPTLLSATKNCTIELYSGIIQLYNGTIKLYSGTIQAQ